MKKNILFVVDNLKMGGVTKVLINMLKKLDTSNYNIDLLVLHYYKDMLVTIPKNINLIKGSNYFHIVDQNLKSLLVKKDIKNVFRKCCFSFNIKTNIISRKIKQDRLKNIKKQYDIEIAFGDGFPYIYTSYGNSIKKIAWMHSDVAVRDYSARYYKNIKNALFKMDLCVAVSDKVATSYKNRYKITKVEVIPNIIDDYEIIQKSELPQEVPFDKNQLNFISVGRLDYSKNYSMLLNVAKHLIVDGYNFKIYIVGDGEEKVSLQKAIINLKMEKHFILLGRKDNPYPYVKNSDLFLLSSRYEGLPTVIIEALILHIPCISTEVAGINQILNPSFGIITKNTEEDFYLNLKYLLYNTQKIIEMKKNLSDYKYNNDIIINKIENILN